MEGRRRAFAVLFTAYGAQYCFGVFFNALLEEFHWSRARVVLGGAMASMAFVHHLWQPDVFYGLVAAIGMGTAYVPCRPPRRDAAASAP